MAKQAQETTEKVEEQSQPLGAQDQETATEETEPFISSAQSVADKMDLSEDDSTDDSDISDSEIDEIVDEVLAEEDGDSSYDETSDSKEESESSEIADGEPTGVQKRIDKLTAQRKTAEEQAAELKEQLIRTTERLKILEEGKKPESTKKEKISEKELIKAIGQFVEEGDNQGILDVINYKVEEMKETLMGEYTKAENQKVESAQRQQAQWKAISNEFSPLSYEDPELKEDPNFDIRNNTSELYKLAERMFVSNPETYNVPNGMKQAVQDAFVKLLKNKLSKVKKSKKPDEAEGLRNRLSKEQRKKSPGSGSSGSEKRSDRAESEGDELSEVINERKKHKNERIGMI